MTKTRQKNADQSIRLLKYIESIEDKSVSDFDKQTSDNLKAKYSKSQHTFQALMEEINNIHLNH